MTNDTASQASWQNGESQNGPATNKATAIKKTTPAFVFDVDGILVKSKTAIPGAREALQLLDDAQVPYIILTNGGGLTEAEHASRLSTRLGSDITIDADQFVQSHTPYRDLVPLYADTPVLVLGGFGHNTRHVARSYGFNHVLTSSDITSNIEHIHPFPEMTSTHHAVYSERHTNMQPAALMSPMPDDAATIAAAVEKKAATRKSSDLRTTFLATTPKLQTPPSDVGGPPSNGYFPTLLEIKRSNAKTRLCDEGGPTSAPISTNNSPLATPQLPVFPPRIAAILVWSSPRDWCLDLQLTLDLLTSVDGTLGTRAAGSGDSNGRPKLYFCNPDLEWATAYKPSPRMAQGAFLEALKGIWGAKMRAMAGNMDSDDEEEDEEGNEMDKYDSTDDDEDDCVIDNPAGVDKIIITNENGDSSFSSSSDGGKKKTNGANGHNKKGQKPKTASADLLQYEICGKPTQRTYEYAEAALDRWWSKKQKKRGGFSNSNTNDDDGETANTVIDKVYMVGDNPASDVAGANAFRSRKGWEWNSVLVGGTGVYRPGVGGMPPAERLTKPTRPDIFVGEGGVLAAVKKVLRERHPEVLARDGVE